MRALDYLDQALGIWIDTVRRWAHWLVFVLAVATGLFGYYTVTHLGIDTDTANMISSQLPWRQTYIDYKESFPQYDDTILIVIEGVTPELAEQARRRLTTRFQAQPKLFKEVYQPGGGKFFQRHGLLYLSVEELERLVDNLAAVQPFLGTLIRDPNLQGFFSMLEEAMQARLEGTEINLVPILDRITEAFGANIEDRFYQLSWQELILDRPTTPDERRRFIVLKPYLDYGTLSPGGPAIEAVQETLAELGIDETPGVRVRITGSVPLAHDELKSVSQGVGVGALLALALVGLILYLGLRSLSLTVATVATLVMGLTATAAFAAATVGELNLISVAFAVLYIGLGVDYSIHLSLRYRELLEQGKPVSEALREATSDVGISLLLCSFTTAVGFYAFLPTAYAGIAELGLISGTGMLISLVANLTFLPAFLSLMPPSPASLRRPIARGALAMRFIDFPRRHARTVRLGALVVGLAAVALLPWVQFDSDFMNLRNPNKESVKTFNDLLDEPEHSPLTLVSVQSDAAAANGLAAKVSQLGVVDKAITLEDFIPKNQTEKLALIDEMTFLLGPELTQSSPSAEIDPQQRYRAIEGLRTALQRFAAEAESVHAATAQQLSRRVKEWQQEVRMQEPAARAERALAVENSLLTTLPLQLKALEAAMQAGPITRSELPAALVERWLSQDNRYRVEIFPSQPLTDEAKIRQFVEQVQTVAPHATGLPVFQLEAADTVVSAFQQAFTYALLAIFILLSVLLRSLSSVTLILAPLVLATILTGSASVLFEIPFNFANVVALPLIFGIGVDNGIHVVHRARLRRTHEMNLLHTSTTRAILFSSLTTLCSFGSLALSPHRGTASIGQLLAIGIVATLVCTLVVLPALLNKREESSAKTRALR